MSVRILLVLLCAVLAGALWFSLAEAPVETTPEPFAKEGAIVRNTPGLVPNVWYLTYEEPGAPAISIPLEFDSESICGPEGAERTCDLSFAQGERVRVSGEKVGAVVRVEKLTLTKLNEEGVPVHLYYYDPKKDVDERGNILCSEKGLVFVERVLPRTQTPLRDAIALLIRGEIAEEEKGRGVTTEFPLTGLALASASIENGKALITFTDPQNTTGGGSCRVSILRAQIEATAKQFPSVKEVEILPEELFQP